ncbi:PAP2 superfamily protein [Actinobacteria bacterium IMCC26207]|nr:PAP2 superfamily protein [Actinobacteria bacterium IMCC26207]
MLTRHRQALQLLLLGLLATAVLLCLYLVFLRTAPGQRFDDIAFEGRKATRLPVRRLATFLVHILTIPSVLLGCAWIAVDTVRRGWWRTGVVALISVALTVVSARFLKGVLIRPELVELAYSNSRNTLPSGHAAAVMAVLLAAVSACQLSTRAFLAPVAAVLAAIYVTALIGSGWHRPSDVVAGMSLAVAVTSIATATRLSLFEDSANPVGNPGWFDKNLAEPVQRVLLQPFRVAGLVSLGAVVMLFLLQNPTSNPSHSLLSFIVAVLTCCLLGMASVFVFAQILGCPRLPSEPETETETLSREAR